MDHFSAQLEAGQVIPPIAVQRYTEVLVCDGVHRMIAVQRAGRTRINVEELHSSPRPGAGLFDFQPRPVVVDALRSFLEALSPESPPLKESEKTRSALCLLHYMSFLGHQDIAQLVGLPRSKVTILAEEAGGCPRIRDIESEGLSRLCGVDSQNIVEI